MATRNDRTLVLFDVDGTLTPARLVSVLTSWYKKGEELYIVLGIKIDDYLQYFDDVNHLFSWCMHILKENQNGKRFEYVRLDTCTLMMVSILWTLFVLALSVNQLATLDPILELRMV